MAPIRAKKRVLEKENQPTLKWAKKKKPSEAPPRIPLTPLQNVVPKDPVNPCTDLVRYAKVKEIGKSVCRIYAGTTFLGTGFVMIGNYILTCAHLFKGFVQGKQLLLYVEIYVEFNLEKSRPNKFYFEKTLVDIDPEHDYAILELKLNEQANMENIDVPPGLLENIVPSPKSGVACFIGHPGGNAQNMDQIQIISKEMREMFVEEHLAKYHNESEEILQTLKQQGIQDIMMGGKIADNVMTYKCSSYKGSSGSPVFDAHGRVFGLHTGGYTYMYEGQEHNVIEFAKPLLIILENIVSNLKASGNKMLLESFKEVAKNNPYVKNILQDPEEPMNTS